MSSNLDVLFPGRDVKIRDASAPEGFQTIRVNPFFARQLPKVFALARDLMPAIKAANGDVMAALALAGDPILEIAALAIGKPLAVFDTMLPDDLIRVLNAVVEENHDFFTQKVGPLMSGLFEMMGRLSGQKPMDGSSSTKG